MFCNECYLLPPIGEAGPAAEILLQRCALTTDYIKKTSAVRLQAHRLLLMREAGPFSKLQWALAGVAPDVLSPPVLEACKTLDRLAVRTLLGPPADHLDDPGEVPPFVDVGELKDDRIDLAPASASFCLSFATSARARTPNRAPATSAWFTTALSARKTC